MRKIEVKGLVEFHQFVQDEIGPLVKPHALFLLDGEVGAGKTELIKKIAAIFKMKDIVQSPTFAFHHLYQSEGVKLHHVDLYRLKSEEDLESTGFWDLFQHEEDVIFVEWAKLVHADAWPWGWKRYLIEIKKLEGTKRQIILSST